MGAPATPLQRELGREEQQIDFCRPGSILDRRTAEVLKAVGVMYWMTHVYPNEQEKCGGMNMDMEAGVPDAGMGR